MKKKFITTLIILMSLTIPNYALAARSQMFGSNDLMNNFSDWDDENGQQYGVGIFDNLFRKKSKDNENYVPEEIEKASPTDPIFKGNEDVQSVLYNSIITPDPRLAPYTGQDTTDYGPRSVIHSTQNMPLFKKYRIKLMNKVRRYEEKTYLNELEKEKKQLAEFEKQLDEEAKTENIFFRYKKHSKPKDIVNLNDKVQEIVIEDENVENITEENLSEEVQAIPLKGKLKEVHGENILVLDAKDIYYVEANDEIIAENSAIVKFPRQKVNITADKFIYSNTNNVIKALGNVKIKSRGHTVYTDYIQINVNEEELTIEKILADFTDVKMEAERGISRNNTLYLYNGYIETEKAKSLRLPARKIKGVSSEHLIPIEEEDKYYIQKSIIKDSKARLFSERIIIDAEDDYDVISLKKSKLYYGKNKVLNIPSITAYTDKSHSVFEASYPELGSVSQLGMFFGPGFAFDVPHAGIMKVIPFINQRKGKFGIGGAVRYRSANNFTEVAYGSVSDIIVAKGYQFLDDNLTLRYGVNSFMDDWFLGPRRPKYGVELLHTGSYTIKDSLKEGLNLNYRQLTSLGYYHNSMYNMNFEHFNGNNFGTMRGRYMAQIQQDLFKYINREKHTRFNLSALMQGSAAIYGNGNTQFIGRMGLNMNSQYKRWVQNISYFLSAAEDNTPMARFDAYRYGTSSVRILEALRLCKFLSLAWTGTFTLSDDSPNKKMLQENAFMFIIGPDDIRVTLGYDYIRKTTYVTLGFSLDTSGSRVDYKVMEIKNPDNFGDDSEKIEELCPDFWLIPEQSAKTAQYKRAQVILLDDDESKERTD